MPILRGSQAIKAHVERLKKIFPALRDRKIDIYATLLAIEKRAHKLAEDECNRPMRDGEVEERTDAIKRELDALLQYRAAKVPVFLNGDPRGYALKIEDAWVREHNVEIDRDWGGYGILAPEF